MQNFHTLTFVPFHLDLEDERLWHGDEAIHLTNKAFKVLDHLLESAGQLVTKEALLDGVWPDTYVSEATLAMCIRELRRALGDSARTPQFIETVRGRGYRFVAPVTRTRPAQQITPTHHSRPDALNPFVSREMELDRLHQWFARALRGERHLGFVTGEAGIGKTALAETFVAQVEADHPVWVARGQCIDQYGAGEPYLPLLEALGRLCRGSDGPYLKTFLGEQAPSWMAQMPALLGAEEREALQQTMIGATQARMLRELAEAVEALTTEQPLLLILEDLHWSDHSTLAWLASVTRRREPARLLILCTYRPVDVIVREHREQGDAGANLKSPIR